jgi:hypothetical protein
MRVKAFKDGFTQGQYRKKGEEFDIPEEAFGAKWMTKDLSCKPEVIDNSKVKKAEDVRHEPLEIVGEVKKRGRKPKVASDESTEG